MTHPAGTGLLRLAEGMTEAEALSVAAYLTARYESLAYFWNCGDRSSALRRLGAEVLPGVAVNATLRRPAARAACRAMADEARAVLVGLRYARADAEAAARRYAEDRIRTVNAAVRRENSRLSDRVRQLERGLRDADFPVEYVDSLVAAARLFQSRLAGGQATATDLLDAGLVVDAAEEDLANRRRRNAPEAGMPPPAGPADPPSLESLFTGAETGRWQSNRPNPSNPGRRRRRQQPSAPAAPAVDLGDPDELDRALIFDEEEPATEEKE